MITWSQWVGHSSVFPRFPLYGAHSSSGTGLSESSYLSLACPANLRFSYSHPLLENSMKHMRQDFLKDFVSWDGDIEFCEDIAQQLYEDGK